MKRLLLILALAMVPAALAARQEGVPTPPPPTIRLTLRPAAEPNPALRVQLLPEAAEQMSGNAALAYYRAFAPEWNRNQQAHQELLTLASKRLSDLPPKAEWADKAGWFGEGQLRELRRAARMTHCDWDLLARLKEGGLGTLMPDIWGVRQYGNWLALKARLAMLEQKPEEALDLLKLQFALARHLGDAPALIHALHGSAVAKQGLEVLEDLLQQPGCPNLYWALTVLPEPFIDWRQALQSERFMFEWFFPDAETTLARNYTPEQFNGVIEQIFERMRRSYVLSANDLRTTVRPGLALLVAGAYPDAKRELIAGGKSEAEVEAMPAAQVVFIQLWKSQRRRFDDAMKWTYLPYRVAEPRLIEATGDSDGLPLPALNGTLGQPYSLLRLLKLKADLERRIAALRCIEAVRLHASAHGGELPQALHDIKAVPVPLDPALGKPFGYRRTTDGFELTADEFAQTKSPLFRTADGRLRYEIAFGK